MERARKVYGLPSNPVARRREASRALRRDAVRVLLARGGLGARPRGRIRAGRRDLLDGCVHRTAAGRAGRAALARRRLPALGDSGVGQLRERQADDAEVGPRSGRPDGARGRRGAGASGAAGGRRAMTTSYFPGEFGVYLDGSALRRRFVGRVRSCGAAPDPLPRPAPHVRDARGARRRVDRRAPGLARPRRGADDDALHALPRAAGRCRSVGNRLRDLEA